MGTAGKRMRKSPVVSVLMPVYNGEKYLREAIDSILSQSFDDFEFLIINDGSTDRSVDIIESYSDPRIRLLHNKKNMGISPTLNRGLDLSYGIYIARMDCDDISMSDRLAKQVEFMDSHPEVGICGTWVETFGEVAKTVWKYPTEPERIKGYLLFYCPLAHPTVMMRQTMLTKYQLRYSPEYPRGEDWQLWQQSSRYFPIANISLVLLKDRITSMSVTRRAHPDIQRNTYRMDIENLKTLGVKISGKEAEFHRIVSFRKFSDDKRFVIKTKNWLERLKKANCRTHIYPEPAFSQILGEFWFGSCNAATSLGFWSWKIFWKTSLSDANVLSWKQKLKFLLKCILKWKVNKIG